MHPLRTALRRTLTVVVGALVAMPFIPAATAPAQAAPTAKISKISPVRGIVTGGAVVTITGKNFNRVTSVRFGSTAAKKYDVVSATKIRAISPALSAGKYKISVTTAAGTVTAAKFTVRTFEKEVLRLTNAARATKRKCGSTTYKAVSALRWDGTLAKVAAGHSRDMAGKNYFSHNSKNGDSPFDRIKSAGYRYTAAGENIAAGYRTPKSVVTGWLKSPGHCKNIMNKSFTELGVGYATGGYYGTYWTQNFGKPR